MKLMKPAALVLSAAILSTSCVGHFRLFNKLAQWNSVGLKEKWLGELIFIGLNFIPVYAICYMADALVFNSIEFWTGDNPIDGVTIKTSGDFKVKKNTDGSLAINGKSGENFKAKVIDNKTVVFSDASGQTVQVEKMSDKYKITQAGKTSYYRPQMAI